MAHDDDRRTPCAVCSAETDIVDVISVGGYPLCRACFDRESTTVASRRRKFYKIDQGKQVAGVCGGLADLGGFDRDAFRAIVVLVTVFTGFVVVPVIYVLLAFLLPVQDRSPAQPD